MLEPGLKMIKMIGLFGVLGLLFYIFKVTLLFYLFSGLAVLLGIILWILILVEQHQDKVLNEQAFLERKKEEPPF
jgi:hypothetical protein